MVAVNMKKLSRRVWQSDTRKSIASCLPPLNFITIHYAYFIFTCLIMSVVFYSTPNPRLSITYTDSLFLVISAMTEAGLNTVNLSQMSTFQQFILWFLIVIGSSIFVSISTLWTRKRVFKQRLRSVGRERRGRRGRRATREGAVDRGLDEHRKTIEPVDKSGFESRHSGPRDPTSSHSSGSGAAKLPDQGESGAASVKSKAGRTRSPVDPDHISVLHITPSADDKQHQRVLSFEGVGAHPTATSAYKHAKTDGLTHRSGHRSKDQEEEKDDEKETELADSDQPYYLNRYTTGRNAQFHSLSRAERQHLGGVEYRALTFLSIVVPLYWVLWQTLGCLGLAAYFTHNNATVPLENGINPW